MHPRRNEGLFRTLTPNTKKPSELIFSRMSSIFMSRHTVPNTLIAPSRHLSLVSRIYNRPRGNANDKAKLRCLRPIAASCPSQALPRCEQTEGKRQHRRRTDDCTRSVTGDGRALSSKTSVRGAYSLLYSQQQTTLSILLCIKSFYAKRQASRKAGRPSDAVL